ncbi:MAG: hypothetical protein E4H24_06940 [Thermomicrobiales bacterium]|nr:MAG: hypothetical protein E4H24_06940 [Thermomicrobiales bacterium]
MTSAADRVSAGLRPARAARPIRPGERIHIIGVSGAGASAAALIAHHAGAIVDGCDRDGPSPYTAALAALGIPICSVHDATHVTSPPTPDRLAVTKALTAVEPDHPELLAARAAGIAAEPWQQVVADAAIGRTLVGVAGTHGKSTTAGWLVHVLVKAGRDPSAFVGALLPSAITGGLAATARWGSGDAFVVEADEYAGNFDPFIPDVAVLTSADWDHPDVFPERSSVTDAFEAWLSRMPDGATLVANVGDPGVETVVDRLRDRQIKLVAYALVDASIQRGGYLRGISERYRTAAGPAGPLLGRIVTADPEGTTVELYGLDPLAGAVTMRLSTAGRHNVANALAVAGSATSLGLGVDEIIAGITSFAGVGRRLERKGESRGVVVYDDYGHHPTAIHETLLAIRQREPGRRVWAVYEPLTYVRTAAMLETFAEVLTEADAVAVADIYAIRDTDLTITSARALADAVSVNRPDMTVLAPGTVEATADALALVVQPGDAVLVMGGGHSYRIGERLLERLDDQG